MAATPRFGLGVNSAERKVIYRWEKDRLVVCVNTDGGDRPQEFKTKKGDKTDLSVYRRR